MGRGGEKPDGRSIRGGSQRIKEILKIPKKNPKKKSWRTKKSENPKSEHLFSSYLHLVQKFVVLQFEAVYGAVLQYGIFFWFLCGLTV